MYKVYKLTFSSGKSYIGQTSRKMITRITQHRQSARTGSLLAVHCAWRMYGEPVVEVLAEADSQEALHAAEIEAISRFKTMVPFGYNLSIGGDTAPSKNAEVAAKISQKAIGRKVGDDVKIMLSQKSKANWGNVEYREKVILAAKASWTPEMRAERSRKSKAFWEMRRSDGWACLDSTREKLKGRVFSVESRAKMSAAAKGKPKAPRSDETKAKLSTNAKAAWEDKDAAATRVAAIRAAWTPEKATPA